MPKLKPFDKIEIVRQCGQLSSTQKLILLIIASHLGKNEFCYLSYNTLQAECCLAKRNAISENLTALAKAGIISILPPSEGFKSNRYSIYFDRLVTNGYQCGNPRLPVRVPTVTSAVTDGYPNRKINKVKRNKRENLNNSESKTKAEEARASIRKACRLNGKGH
jgi:hypothetical protein